MNSKNGVDFKDIISSILPTGLLEHFEITDFKELGYLPIKKDCYFFSLEEKNRLPDGYDMSLYESKGFFDSKMIQDFPIRGRAVYLIIKRRRWRLKSDHKQCIKSDYSFIADGVKLTQEVADFLKGTGRDPRKYDK